MSDRQPLALRSPKGTSEFSDAFNTESKGAIAPSIAPSASGEGPATPASPIRHDEGSLRDRLEDACHRVESGERGPARLDQLAEFLGVSARHANRCFHAAGFTSPMKEIRRRKLRDALDRIRYSTRTLEEIAVEFDYYDGSSLSRALKRAFGISPTLLRDGRVRTNRDPA